MNANFSYEYRLNSRNYVLVVSRDRVVDSSFIDLRYLLYDGIIYVMVVGDNWI